MYEVSPSPVGRRVRFNSGIECEFTFDSLARTEAGRVALGLSISSHTLEGRRRSVFEIEEVGEDSGKRSKGRWWDVLSFLSLCWRSEEWSCGPGLSPTIAWMSNYHFLNMHRYGQMNFNATLHPLLWLKFS